METKIDTSRARAAILERVKKGQPALKPLPDLPGWTWPGDKTANFIKQLEAFDGKAARFDSRAEAVKWLEENVDKKGKVVCSQIADFKGTVTAADYPDPHKCTDIDVFVADSSLGVGEMGSLLLTQADLGIPPAALLSIDMYVLIDEANIVDGLHTAYKLLAPQLRDHCYACFFSGPSATADIEAVHVTGAQGEISLTALIYKS